MAGKQGGDGMSIDFLLTALVIVASPGTGAIYTLAAGLSGGARTSLVAAFGCTLGSVPHMIAAISGLAALFHASALAFQVLKWLGVAYLLFMAWSMFKSHGVLPKADTPAAKSNRQVISTAILINLLNPKLLIFFLSFLPQFVEPSEARPVLLMLQLSLVFLILTFVVFAVYGIFASYLRHHIVSSAPAQRWMSHGFAAAFAALAIHLAFITE